MHDFRGYDVAPAGSHLLEELNSRGWTQAEFANILGRPIQFVSEIVTSKKEITRESATQIAAALGTSPEYWLRLQDSYHLAMQRENTETSHRLDTVRRRAHLRETYPIPLLAQRGLVHASDPDEQEQDILRLYRIQAVDQQPEFALAAKRTNVAEPLTQLQEAWFVTVRDKAAPIQVAEYDKDAFGDLAAQLPASIKSADDFNALPARFARVGVKLVHIDAFPSSKLDGCAFVDNGSPVIGLSGRGKRLDKVFFTLLHEVAHVVLGHVGEAPIVDEADPVQGGHIDIESEANALASRWSFGDGLPVPPTRVSETWIAKLADEFDVHPLMVIGRMQHEGTLSWRTSLVRDAPTVSKELKEWG